MHVLHVRAKLIMHTVEPLLTVTVQQPALKSGYRYSLRHGRPQLSHNHSRIGFSPQNYQYFMLRESVYLLFFCCQPLFPTITTNENIVLYGDSLL